MKITIIGNPIAGSGKANRQIEGLGKILERQGHLVDIFMTRVSGDAGRWANRIKPDTDIIIVAGGDGTLNEVLNGITDPSHTPSAL